MAKNKTLSNLFTSTEKWTKGTYARTSKNASLNCELPDEVLKDTESKYKCFCLLGGILKVYGNFDVDNSKASKVLYKLAEVIDEQYPDRTEGETSSGCAIANFNDNRHTTFRDIKKVINLANV